MPRRGLNCTLSYTTRKGKTFNYRVRCKRLTKGYVMVAEESQARTSRAFYPRKTSPTQFAITLDIIGKRERNSFNNYMMEYAAELLAQSGTNGQESVQMRVQIPSRNFLRLGVPLSGIEFGTVVGEMVFNPTLVFETSREPLDWNAEVISSSVQADLAAMKSDASKYFYPTGVQLKGDDQAAALTEAVNNNTVPPDDQYGDGPGY